MLTFKKYLLYAILATFTTAFDLPPKKIRVFLIGDSTVSHYEPQSSPLTGWGTPFAHFFDSTVVVVNHARGGRSTRTFISENRWQAVVNNLQEDDYVFIQFGHNDEAKEEKYKDRYTPVSDYKANLIKFVTETSYRNANPILVTPVTRRRFDKDGKIMETHKEYTAAMSEVSKELSVPLIDLDKKSRDLLQQFGPEHSKLLFMELFPGEHPNYPEGQKDKTHFNEYGARRMASLVLEGINESSIDLNTRIVKPSLKK